MRVYIKGCDSIEIEKITGRHQSKHFLKYAEQVYKMYPDGFHRCFIYRKYLVILSKP